MRMHHTSTLHLPDAFDSGVSPVSSPGFAPSSSGDVPPALGVRIAVLTAILFLCTLGTAAMAQANPFAASSSDPFFGERRNMVNDQVRKRGIEEPNVLEAMETVPRHLFVPEIYQLQAYEDTPVSIAPGQTLSQAYLSARMIALLDLDGDEKVLEIGTGSGYDAALLSRMAREVHTIEIDNTLGRRARSTLKELGYGNVEVHIGDGYRGWPEEAPFDAILVTAAPERVPDPLIDQLAIGGKMVLAVGRAVQELQVITKTAEDSYNVRKINLVNLGPMTGEVQQGGGGN